MTVRALVVSQMEIVHPIIFYSDSSSLATSEHGLGTGRGPGFGTGPGLGTRRASGNTSQQAKTSN